MVSHSIKFLVADDHDGILYFVSKYIMQCFPDAKIAEFRNGQSVVHDIKTNSYDIYIVDIELKDMLGFELIKCIRKKYKDSRIIVYSMHDEMWFINQLKHINVNGIVLKSSPIECLKDAITQVYGGGQYFCGHFTELKNPYNLKNPNSDLLMENFSDKDMEILQLIAEGYTTKEIAVKIGWAEETVKSYRKDRLLKRFNVKNPASLVARATLQKYIRNIKLKDDN